MCKVVSALWMLTLFEMETSHIYNPWDTLQPDKSAKKSNQINNLSQGQIAYYSYKTASMTETLWASHLLK
jgi:hypothetical protein